MSRPRTVGEDPGDGYAKDGEHDVGSEEVDHDADAHPFRAVIGLDHRDADEGGIAEPSHQNHAAGGAPRQLQSPADRPEQAGADQEQDPGHQSRIDQRRIERHLVQRAEGQRRQADVDDETVERRGRVVRKTARPAQHDAGCKTEKEQEDVAHRSPRVPARTRRPWLRIAKTARSVDA
jgi:hypothetical protein